MPAQRDSTARQVAETNPEFHDERDSLFGVVVSLVAFAAAEFFVELNIDSLPGGLVFPVGFILFWAFYYTYYRPNTLENRLKPLSEMSFPNVFGIVFGVLVWFVKVTVVGLFDMVFVRWWNRPAAAKSKARPAQKSSDEQTGSYKTGSYHANAGSYSSYRPRPENTSSKAPPGPKPLPSDLQTALHVLGIEDRAPTWDAIHKRYRELAKKFHPDLAGDITQGHRFIRLDQAYRKLSSGKGTFFK